MEDSRTTGWPGSYSCQDVDVVVALVYEREAEYGVRCVEFEEESAYGWGDSSKFEECASPGVFKYTWDQVNPYDTRDCDMLRAACDAFASAAEVKALVEREEELDVQTSCKNEIFYRGGSKPRSSLRSWVRTSSRRWSKGKHRKVFDKVSFAAHMATLCPWGSHRATPGRPQWPHSPRRRSVGRVRGLTARGLKGVGARAAGHSNSRALGERRHAREGQTFLEHRVGLLGKPVSQLEVCDHHFAVNGGC